MNTMFKLPLRPVFSWRTIIHGVTVFLRDFVEIKLSHYFDRSFVVCI